MIFSVPHPQPGDLEITTRKQDDKLIVFLLLNFYNYNNVTRIIHLRG